jgi:hypothetical protein
MEYSLKNKYWACMLSYKMWIDIWSLETNVWSNYKL